MRVTILSDSNSWMNPIHIPHLIDALGELDFPTPTKSHDHTECPGGDILCVLSYQQIIPKSVRDKYQHTIVAHASDLPQGRGWSPWVWQILAGKKRLVASLFEAVEAVDAGPVYAQERITLGGHELLNEIRNRIGSMCVMLCFRFLQSYPAMVRTAKAQQGKSSMFPKRTPKDSELQIDKPIKELFPLLRVVDNDRYPAFFEMNGYRYKIKIEKMEFPA